MRKTSPLYLIPVLSKALDILELLQAEGVPMTLEAIYKRTRFSKTTVYRVLKTLVHRGYLAQLGDGTYRHLSRQKKVCFGFGSQSRKMPFAVAVEESLRAAAVHAGVDLVVLDNDYDGSRAIANADEFVRRGVNLVIEFQTEQSVAPIVADKIFGARIPLIAVDIPHPHATYFGVDNFRCGVAAGEVLAQEVKTRWKGEVDWVLGLDLDKAGPIVHARVTGAFEGLRRELPWLAPRQLVRVNADGLREAGRDVVLAFLGKHPKSRRILIVAANDMSALGAIDAARQLRRQRHVLVVGQDAIAEMLKEMQRANSPAVATVSHHAEQYGRPLIHLGLALLRGEHVPPYNLAEHGVLTASQTEDTPGDENDHNTRERKKRVEVPRRQVGRAGRGWNGRAGVAALPFESSGL